MPELPIRPSEQPSAGPRSYPLPRNPCVLVVEDDESLRSEIAEVFHDDGYRVLQSADGSEALEMLRQSPDVDVVLLDLWMPDMDGWSFRSEQRASPALRDIPVIVLSADASPQARSIDADAFIRKPFDVEALSATARRVISEHRADNNKTAALVSETVSLLAGAISHEVADPLMTLIAQVERLKDSGGVATRASAEQMLDQCWRIAGALRTLRDLPCPSWAREREVDLSQMVRAAVAWTGDSNIRFRMDIPPDIRVHGDPLIIVYVCTAVLRNAIEAIPKADLASDAGRPHVEVRLSRSDDEIVLDVRDHGATIPQEDLERLFSIEYPGRSRAWSTGLRLWFVRQAVLGLGGAVEVSNASPSGVRCRLRLPVSAKTTAGES